MDTITYHSEIALPDCQPTVGERQAGMVATDGGVHVAGTCNGHDGDYKRTVLRYLKTLLTHKGTGKTEQ